MLDLLKTHVTDYTAFVGFNPKYVEKYTDSLFKKGSSDEIQDLFKKIMETSLNSASAELWGQYIHAL